MRKKISDEEADKLLEEQYIREAKEMEAGLLRSAGIAVSYTHLGNILSMFLEMGTGEFGISAGASGAVFAVMGAMVYAVIRGRGRLEDLSLRQILIMTGFSLYFGFASEGVDNAAHVGGMICGFLLCMLLYHPGKNLRNSEDLF